MNLLPKTCSAYAYQIRHSTSVRGKGLNANNANHANSVLRIKITEICVLGRIKFWVNPDPAEGDDFSAIDFCDAKSLLWGDLQRKSENSATHGNLLQIPQLLAQWRSFNMSGARRRLRLSSL